MELNAGRTTGSCTRSKRRTRRRRLERGTSTTRTSTQIRANGPTVRTSRCRGSPSRRGSTRSALTSKALSGPCLPSKRAAKAAARARAAKAAARETKAATGQSQGQGRGRGHGATVARPLLLTRRRISWPWRSLIVLRRLVRSCCSDLSWSRSSTRCRGLLERASTAPHSWRMLSAIFVLSPARSSSVRGRWSVSCGSEGES